MRKHYLDNIRIICMLLLFPFHAIMLFNNWGEAFFVYSEPLSIAGYFHAFLYPWWMPLLFTISGISSAYSLKKRTIKKFARERVSKLFIPFLMGLIFIVPIQTYIADTFHNGYSGNYFQHYYIFFTKITDLSGFDGGLTPSHTWFILYLFIATIIMLPIIKWYRKKPIKINGRKLSIGIILPLFIVILVSIPIIRIGNVISFGEAFACFALGYFVLSNDKVQETLKENRIMLFAFFLIFIIIKLLETVFSYDNKPLIILTQSIAAWFGILSFLGMGKKHLEFSNRFTEYFSKASFPLYYLHQSILITIGFFTIKNIKSPLSQFLIILSLSFVLTILCYELFRRLKLTCFLFGIKHKSKTEKSRRRVFY